MRLEHGQIGFKFRNEKNQANIEPFVETEVHMFQSRRKEDVKS